MFTWCVWREFNVVLLIKIYLVVRLVIINTHVKPRALYKIALLNAVGVLLRCDPHRSFEVAIKMALIVESGFLSNIGYFHSLTHQALCESKS